MGRGGYGRGGGFGLAVRRRGRGLGWPGIYARPEVDDVAEIDTEKNRSDPWREVREELAAIRERLHELEAGKDDQSE
jgi:hypothetical protein